jgi:hypothetical protein
MGKTGTLFPKPGIYRFHANPAEFNIEKQRGENITPSAVLAPGSALRSRPRVAVSSVQAEAILSQSERSVQENDGKRSFSHGIGIGSAMDGEID